MRRGLSVLITDDHCDVQCVEISLRQIVFLCDDVSLSFAKRERMILISLYANE